jgi:hypothetical protein
MDGIERFEMAKLLIFSSDFISSMHLQRTGLSLRKL